MLADGTDDQALWTASGTETYEFVNKQNTTNGVNANLRMNQGYGFACYATGTGGALSLYKLVNTTEYTITTAQEVENNITTSEETALEGDEVDIIVVAPNGKQLNTLIVTKELGGNVTINPSVSAAVSEYSFIMPASNVTISATFEDIPTYNVTVNEDATMGTVIGTVSYFWGEEATVMAEANSGFFFINWTENGEEVSTEETYSFIVTRDITLTANFRPAYTVTFNAGTGTCLTNPITESDLSGIELPEASPSDLCGSQGWTFAGWSTSAVSETTT